MKFLKNKTKLKTSNSKKKFYILIVSKLQGTKGSTHLKGILRRNKYHCSQHLCKWKAASQLDAAAWGGVLIDAPWREHGLQRPVEASFWCHSAGKANQTPDGEGKQRGTQVCGSIWPNLRVLENCVWGEKLF